MDRRGFLRAAALGGAAASVLGGAPDAEARPAPGEAGRVPRRPLGRTGVTVPILQLGTAQRLDPVYDRILHRSVQAGADALDTALSYGSGSSHRAIATFIGQLGDRRRLWLTSKSTAGNPRRLGPDLDRALAELRTDYLDCYLLHGISDVDMLGPEWLRAGDALRRSAKTRFFGFSCHGGRLVELMTRAAQAGGVDVVLFRLSFRQQRDPALDRAIDVCHEAGIGLFAMKTWGGVPADAEKVVAFRSRQFTLGQAKLKAVWADRRIASVVSEMDSLQVAAENVAAARSEDPLGASERRQLDRLAALTAPLACQGCAHLCEGAVGGRVAIADPLRFLSYQEAYGDQARARALYRAIPSARRLTDGVDLTAAAAACPQGIDVAARLCRARVALDVG